MEIEVNEQETVKQTTLKQLTSKREEISQKVRKHTSEFQTLHQDITKTGNVTDNYAFFFWITKIESELKSVTSEISTFISNIENHPNQISQIQDKISQLKKQIEQIQGNTFQ